MLELGEYQRLFPGHEERIAEEYRRLTSEAPATGGDGDGIAGRRIGRYVLVEELGRGGQGTVYLAEDSQLGRRIALKVLSNGLIVSDRARQRFAREAEAASRLNHPGICSIYDVGEDGGVPFIAMEHVPGVPLSRSIAMARAMGADPSSDSASASSSGPGDRASIMDVVEKVESVSRALHVAHEAGLVHRDVKPANIMIAEGRPPVVLDFGLAHADEDGAATLTRTGDLMGTPAYLAPERLRDGGSAPDPRCDVYALGVTLYEALTLRRPFDAPTRDALYRAILITGARDPRLVNPKIPKDLAVVVLTALEKNPDHRFRTAEHFAEELRRVREYEPILTKPAGPWRIFVRWCQRSPSAAAATFVLLGALLATAWFLVQARIERDRATANLADWRVLADGQRLAKLVAEAERDHWPATPDKVPRMEAWLGRAEELLDRLPVHRAALEAMDELGAEDPVDPDLDRVRARLDEITQVEADLQEKLDRARAEGANAWTTGGLTNYLAAARRHRAAVEGEWEAASELAEARNLRVLEEPREQLKYEELRELVDGLEALAAPVRRGRVTVELVETRLEEIRALRQRTVEDFAEAWDETVAGIAASPKYDGMELSPQVGLIPLGPDPESGLYEFSDWQTGEVPERFLDGELSFEEGNSLVFVLLPAATFWMGAQNTDDRAPNHDLRSFGSELPVHQVRLDAFFISKYEMTQAQWLRVTSENPARYRPSSDSRYTHHHPVESIDWRQATAVTRRLGFDLPTEAQWEYACRGGTETPHHVADVEELVDHANLVNLPDGFNRTSPVGFFFPNPFGLYDMHGNVAELCRDRYAHYFLPTAPGDGRRIEWGGGEVCYRGGSFDQTRDAARSAARGRLLQNDLDAGVGLRPVRRVDP